MKQRFFSVLIILLTAFVLLSFVSCKQEADTPSSNLIPRAYWGTWIQMDTGTAYYIDDSKIYESSSSNKKYREISSGIGNYRLDSEDVLKKGNTVYFRKGGSTRNFSVQVAGFSDSYSRSVGTGKQGVTGRRQNENNSSDNQSGQSDSNGTITFTNAVADDTQSITIVNTTATVTPKYNGENLGTIPIVENGMYGFKTTYTIDSDAEGFCYGNYYKAYNLILNINNIGTETCSTSMYSISCTDSKLQFISGSLSGNFSSIEPGKSKGVSFKIRYAELNQEYIDVPISISITDSKYERTWNDSVTIRFHKGTVALKVNSRNFDSNSNAKLNGFVIYPDGRSKRFTVSAGSTSTVLIPWSGSDYHIAFSGATTSNEMGYSFGFSEKTSLADLTGTWTIQEINGYESNDSINSAYRVTDLSYPVKAYLKNEDIDFYTVNCSEIEVKFTPVVYQAHGLSDASSYSDINNGDNTINPGETIKMDIRLQNVTDQMVSEITAILSTTSEYVTIAEASKSYGNIKGKYYKTLYGTSYYASSSSYRDGWYLSDYSSNYSATLSASYGWQFTVDPSTPFGTVVPFTLSFTDAYGNTWLDSFSVTVVKADVDITYHTQSISDATSYSSINNGDNMINPGETIKIDVRLQNKGTSLAQGIMAVLSTTSEYVTIAEASKSYGNIKGGYYKTLYGTSYYASNSSYRDGNSYVSDYSSDYSATLSASYGWQFTVDASTPFGTVVPFTLSFTDAYGNTWSDSFSVTVVKVDVNLKYDAYDISDLTSYSDINNGDGIINPGETMKIDVRIKNIGTSLARGITAVLSTTSGYITITEPSKSYGNIKAGGYFKTLYGASYYANNSLYCDGTAAYGNGYTPSASYGWQFTVAENTPVGTIIPFTLLFTDIHSNTWTDSFSVTVQ
ncbi:MAG: hypothetical protein J5747_09105 [Spirochaetaceae bacterium]|nr:hypothetical protein [Spirochaetaceae bacterium]